MGESNHTKKGQCKEMPNETKHPPQKKTNKSPNSFIYTQRFSIQPQCMGNDQKVFKCAYV